jgi:hypothetical protein
MNEKQVVWIGAVLLFGLLGLSGCRRSEAEREKLQPESRPSQAEADSAAPTRGLLDEMSSLEKADAADYEQRNQRRSELVELLHKEHGYALAPDERVKFMPAESAPAVHDEYVRLTAGEGRELTSLFRFRDGRLEEASWHRGDPRKLAILLDSLLGLKLHRIEGDADLLNTPMHGDWILAPDFRCFPQLDADEVAALQSTLREQGLPLRLELKTEERFVYVATGDYRFKPIAGPDGKVDQVSGRVAEQADGSFQIPARRTGVSGSVAHGFDELLEQVGEVLMVPIVDEITSRPTKNDFFSRFSGKPVRDIKQRLDVATEKRVLEAMSEQTGLTFTEDIRPVQILFVTRE